MSYHISTKPLLKGVLILFIMWLFFAGIFYARPFIEPLAYAAIFSMLLWPISRKMEAWGVNKNLANFLSVLMLVVLVVVVFYFLSNQIKSFTEDWPQLKQSFDEKLSQAKDFLDEKFGISEKQQEQAMEQTKSGATQMGKRFAQSMLSIFAQTLLMLVYIFLLLLYRARLKNFILKYTPEESRKKVHQVILDAAHVAKGYLSGRLLLMLILAVCYCTGLSIIGVQHAIFFGLLAAILGIIPFIGNIIGGILPLSMALMNQGTSAALAVIGLFTVIQLIENYFLEPIVVGKKVDLNAFFSIAVVVLGEIVWGISGAILAMPFLGIAKIVFDSVKQLQPIGYLMGETEEKDDADSENVIIEKVKKAFGKS